MSDTPRLVFRPVVAMIGTLKEGRHWHCRPEQWFARCWYRPVAESLWVVGRRLLEPISRRFVAGKWRRIDRGDPSASD